MGYIGVAIFSFLPIFSSSTNLVYVVGKGTPWDIFQAFYNTSWDSY